ncbi:hypothetical protein [Mesorhizobium sp. M1403]|uniref:hypothetical protein n=1 Tax=Mesorhizobium sp. M1403 TaxID=2957097 RepID=UPI00333A7CBF
MFVIWLGLCVFLPGPTLAQETAKPWSHVADGDLKLAVVVTDNADYEKLWYSMPREATPHFSTIEKIGLGQTAFVVAFFAGAAAKDSKFQIVCEATIKKPNGELVEVPPTPCFSGPARGPLTDLRLVDFSLGINAEPQDPSGLWRIEYRMHDPITSSSCKVGVSLEVDVPDKKT